MTAALFAADPTGAKIDYRRDVQPILAEFCLNIQTCGRHRHGRSFTMWLAGGPGIDHTQLTYRFQGRDYRLTDVHGEIVKEILL